MEGIVCSMTSNTDSFKAAVMRSKYNRANSTSTIKVNHTMSHPNNDATIRAVSARLRKYIVSGDKKLQKAGGTPQPKDPLTRFNETSYQSDSSSEEEEEERKYEGQRRTLPRLRSARPSLHVLANYLNNMFVTAQCSEECNIICLLYIERLLNETNQTSTGLNSENWKSILMVSMLLASKVWDDLSMVNEDFSIFMPYSLDQINAWEIHFLSCLKFNVRVSAGQYASYYFELRKDCHEWGLEVPPMKELSMQQAKQLEILSSRHNDKVSHLREASLLGLRRTKSIAACRPNMRERVGDHVSQCRYVID